MRAARYRATGVYPSLRLLVAQAAQLSFRFHLTALTHLTSRDFDTRFASRRLAPRTRKVHPELPVDLPVARRFLDDALADVGVDGDVIQSAPTRASERALAPHPSLKPQAFLRQLARAVLPCGEGIVLDPFAGAGSTLAAAEAVGYMSVGVEKDAHYFDVARKAISQLAKFTLNGDTQSR